MSQQTQQETLINARDRFALYAQEHRAKASRLKAEQLGCSDEAYNKNLDMQIVRTIQKAQVNEEMVVKIQESLATGGDVLTATADFGHIAYSDGISIKNKQTQLGVHFEEVAEMCDTLGGYTPDTTKLLNKAEKALHALADHLKNSTGAACYIQNKTDFLDSICDQLVTATLSGVLYNMKVVPALAEVNRSNYSKLVDGVMTKDPATAKWIKGPNYKPPNLHPYI